MGRRATQKTLLYQGEVTRVEAHTHAFAHEISGVESEMLWHQVMRPNERWWRGGEEESAREDVLLMCALHVPTREKGCWVERREGIERACGCVRCRGERNSGPQVGFGQVKVPNRNRRNNETMVKVEKGEEHGRAAVLQDTMSIAVADFGCFAQGELGGG